ncbi:MAG: hypothetical protein K2W82_16180 [Candidatus Obscuribacterales bacterium]|nr:hypothetical protein [Candidatus Obscuribacterales bacterium]
MELTTLVSGHELGPCKSISAAQNHIGSEVRLELPKETLLVTVNNPLNNGRWEVTGDLELMPVDSGASSAQVIAVRPSSRAVIKGHGFGLIKLVHFFNGDNDKYVSIEVKVKIRSAKDTSWYADVIEDETPVTAQTNAAEAALASLITLARSHVSGEKVFSADDLAKAILACAGK